MSTQNKKGAATLFMAVILIVVVTIMVIFSANLGITLQKLSANQNRNLQAFNAAEAGIEYAIVYLNNNTNTITANPVGGFISYGSGDTNLTNVSLANNARFSVVYSNPTANNYLLLTITSTGTSDDGSATRVLKQQVYGGISNLGAAMTTKGNFTSSGNMTITGAMGIMAQGSVILSGSNNISSYSQNDATLQALTNDAMFAKFLGGTKAQVKSQSTVFPNTTGLNFSTLTGKNWIDSSVVSSGTKVVGTPASPVLLIINGNLISSGSFTVYGLLYVLGSITTSGNNSFNGGVVTEGSITMSGSVGAYDSTYLTPFTTRTYAKVPGSWIDI